MRLLLRVGAEIGFELLPRQNTVAFSPRVVVVGGSEDGAGKGDGVVAAGEGDGLQLVRAEVVSVVDVMGVALIEV